MIWTSSSSSTSLSSSLSLELFSSSSSSTRWTDLLGPRDRKVIFLSVGVSSLGGEEEEEEAVVVVGDEGVADETDDGVETGRMMEFAI